MRFEIAKAGQIQHWLGGRGGSGAPTAQCCRASLVSNDRAGLDAGG
jgi:hypothetical protein